jgi:hypothetical protein
MTNAMVFKMHEYSPLWIAPEETPKTQSDAPVKTDKSPSVRFDSASPSYLEQNTPEDLERLKEDIIAALDVEPGDFDYATYLDLLARWNALRAHEDASRLLSCRLADSAVER